MKKNGSTSPDAMSTTWLNKVWWLGLAVAFVVACLVRLPYFSQVPVGLNRDEVGLGYNAFSLLKTGADEYGTPWPVSIKSFGDQKLPGYIYTLVPLVATFGLHDWTVRLPALLAGFSLLASLGWLSWRWGREWQMPPHWQVVLSVTTMLLVAISPWGNHFSRVAYEAHLAMAWFSAGLVCVVYGLDQSPAHRQRWWLVAAAAAWSAALLTYHSYHIFIPLFVVWCGVTQRRALRAADRRGLVMAFALGVLTIAVMATGHVWDANVKKSQGISPFHKADLQRSAAVYRQSIPGENVWYEKVLFNSVTEAGLRLATNLVSLPTGDFFFIQGTPQNDHNPGGTPNHHLFIAPLMLIGLLGLWEHRQRVASQLLAGWLGLAMVAPALTIQPQHTTRFSPAFPVVEILAALGLILVAQYLYKWRPLLAQLMMAGMVVVASWFTGRYMLTYLVIVPPLMSGHEHDHLLAQTLMKYEQKYQADIITQSPSSSPYIWYVYEQQLHPQVLNQDIERYPIDQENFHHVKRIGRIHFESINWDDLVARSHTSGLILVFKPQETPGEWRHSSGIQLLDSIVDSQGQVAWEVWQMGSVF